MLNAKQLKSALNDLEEFGTAFVNSLEEAQQIKTAYEIYTVIEPVSAGKVNSVTYRVTKEI